MSSGKKKNNDTNFQNKLVKQFWETQAEVLLYLRVNRSLFTEFGIEILDKIVGSDIEILKYI